MNGPSDIDEDWAAMAEEMQSHDCEFRLYLDPLNAFRLVSMLQLAIRHPQLPDGHVHLAREMLDSAEERLTIPDRWAWIQSIAPSEDSARAAAAIMNLEKYEAISGDLVAWATGDTAHFCAVGASSQDAFSGITGKTELVRLRDWLNSVIEALS